MVVNLIEIVGLVILFGAFCIAIAALFGAFD